MQLGIVILLGNFHTQMSFLGSIDYLMKNSGLAQAISTIYGEESVKYILNGKSYERATRAHGLVTSVLKKLLIEQINPSEQYAVEAACDYFVSLIEIEDNSPFDPSIQHEVPVVKNLMEVLQKVKSNLSDSALNKLYIMYVDM